MPPTRCSVSRLLELVTGSRSKRCGKACDYRTRSGIGWRPRYRRARPSGNRRIRRHATARLAILFDHGRDPTRDGLALARASSPDDTGWAEARARVVEEPIPSFPFTGRDVMAKGLKGAAVGAALARLREAFRKAGFPPDVAAREELLDAAVDAEERSRSQPTA